MSALHPKADMCSARVDVCFGPMPNVRFGSEADIPNAKDSVYCNPAQNGHNWLPRLTVTTVNQANNKSVPNAVTRIFPHMDLETSIISERQGVQYHQTNKQSPKRQAKS